MNDYRHHVSGFFAQRDEAQNTLSRLVERGLPRERLQLFESDSAAPDQAPKGDSNAVLKNMVVDGAIGTAVGTGIGALAQIALVAANVSLFIASPLIAPLAMLGWGASLGGLIGAATGAATGARENSAATGIENKEGWFSELVRDAISSGQVVLLVETRTEQETAIAREVIQASVGGCEDINTG